MDILALGELQVVTQEILSKTRHTLFLPSDPSLLFKVWPHQYVMISNVVVWFTRFTQIGRVT